MATTSVPMNPRPPLPQRALERVSPFEGLPQRALHRSPPFAPRSCRIRPVSSPPRNCAAALGFLTPDRKLGGKGCDNVPLLREKRQIHSFEGLALKEGPARQLAQAAAAQLAAFHEAAAHEAAAHDALFHEAAAQLAAAHEAFAQEAVFHEAELQEALFQEALFHDASAWATLAQLAASKASPPEPSERTNWSSARFGFGALATIVAAFASTSPTPSALPAAELRCALTISAPLTWSGVQP